MVFCLFLSFCLTADDDGIYFTLLLHFDTALDEYVGDGDTDDDGEDDGHAVNAEAQRLQ